MFKGKEIAEIILVWIFLVFAISLFKLEEVVSTAVFVIIILAASILAEKLAAYYFEAEIETKVWRARRFGLKPWMYLKKPIPLGILLPLFFSLFSLGYFVWMAALEFDVKPAKHRAAKRHGFYSYHEMTEWHIGCIASFGIFASLILAIIAYLAGYPELSRLSVYFACFNMLPISNLDGNKIFFGSRILWTTLAVICLIFLGYAIFLI